ncbi:MAG: TonB family protein [Rhodoplanes sp.]|uniref:TonB family protein n=1 Tax=Rhodoplanes sp. TaxID=1968906 RepID=UPI00182900E0|nr:TonB family protein [Rhodoplanes sp.]NVO17598.1 TonB family protein [Rhodoplanes sp.]
MRQFLASFHRYVLGCLIAGAVQNVIADSVAAETPLPMGGAGVRSTGPVAFDIPAQPLVSALEAYGIAAGREVVYNGNLAMGRRTTGVKGVFTPETALHILLDGTGLSPRYMADDAFVLVPTTALPSNLPTNTASPHVVARYYGRIQGALRQAFCFDAHTRPSDYRVAVSFWIAASGTVSRVEILGSTGDSDLDSAVDDKIRGLPIGAPPPGFAQPVTLVVAPRSQGAELDCETASAPPPTARVSRP